MALVLCLLLAVLTYFKQNQGVGGGGEERRRPQEAVVRGPGGRRGGARMRRPVEREDSDEEAGQEEREELEEAGIKVPDGKIGKKKMEKLQAKADKKLQREAEQKEREENKKKREKMDEEEKLKREQEKEEERKIEEEERKIREEKERKEQEEYDKLKAAFSVEEEGCDAGEEGDEENKLLKFINYIKETKVYRLHNRIITILASFNFRLFYWKILLPSFTSRRRKLSTVLYSYKQMVFLPELSMIGESSSMSAKRNWRPWRSSSGSRAESASPTSP